MKHIILASQSPRRRELLSAMGLQFTIVPSNFEEYLDDAREPEEVAKELGLGKALDVAKQYPESIVIGSDIIVTVGNRQLGKASDEAEAREMLGLVMTQPNKLSSSIAVVCLAENIQLVGCENAWVYFKPYDTELVETYIGSGDWKDKAAAYGVQSGAAPMVDHVEGNADTIMGLPTHTLAPMLQKLGIAAHPVNISLPLLIGS